MNNCNLIFILLLIPMLVLVNCSRKQNKEDPPSSSTDSPASKTPDAPPSLPPNSALISGNVESVDTLDEEELRIAFRITTISKYGPATKPLSENQRLDLTVGLSFLNKKGIDMSSGDSLRLVISQTMALDQMKRRTTWRIVDFK